MLASFERVPVSENDGGRPLWPKVASTRIHNHARQRGKKSELVADPGLMTKQPVKEGVDVLPGVVAGLRGRNEEATITATADYNSHDFHRDDAADSTVPRELL